MRLPMHLLLQLRLHVTRDVRDWEATASMEGKDDRGAAGSPRRGPVHAESCAAVRLLPRRQQQLPGGPGRGDRLREALPDLYDSAWANRGFHQRSARWMASEHGIGQFIDIGCGLPTKGTTYQAIWPVTPGRARGIRGQRPDGARSSGNCSPTTRTPG